jgi:hypothetical protein
MVMIFCANAGMEVRKAVDRALAKDDIVRADAWLPIINTIDDLLKATPDEAEA